MGGKAIRDVCVCLRTYLRNTKSR